MLRYLLVTLFCFSFTLGIAQKSTKFDNLFDSANKYEDVDWNLAFYYAKMAMDNRGPDVSYSDIISLNVIFDTHYQKMNMLDSSFSINKQSLKLSTDHKDTTLIAYSLINIANIYVAANNNEAAIQMYKKALSILLRLNDIKQIANTYYNLSTPYSNLHQYDLSKYYTDRAFQYYKKINDFSGIALCYDVYGTEADRNKEYKEAIRFYELEIQQFKLANEPANLIIPYQNIADTYLKIKDYVSCKHYLELGMNLAISLGSKSDVYEISHIYSKYYEALGDYKQANFYMRRYFEGKDTIINDQLKTELSDQKSEFDRENSETMLTIQKLEAERNLKSKEAFRWILIISTVFFIIVLILAVNRYRAKQKSFLKLNEYKNQLIQQKEKIEETQKEITDSIHYAKRIQNTLLTNKEFIDAHVASNFILFKPKDIVSGDFYWATQKEHYFYLAVCDSTGHGVPGAFISLLNIGFLSEAINEKHILEPHLVFNYVRDRLIGSVSRDGYSDGFDGVLLRINTRTREMVYAAANSAPILIANEQIVELPKDKMPVGQYEQMTSFNLHSITCKATDTLYLYTDGFADQFGGPKAKKLKYKQLNEYLVTIKDLPMKEQHQRLNQFFEEWKGSLEQVDDVCVVGLKL
ncbi:MAG: SpoIIE family protein phosphatase [Bacteroidetes bacterium]|nr:SpoIIE family protein phosphatase [Bacteroidota bacterium]